MHSESTAVPAPPRQDWHCLVQVSAKIGQTLISLLHVWSIEMHIAHNDGWTRAETRAGAHSRVPCH